MTGQRLSSKNPSRSRYLRPHCIDVVYGVVVMQYFQAMTAGADQPFRIVVSPTMSGCLPRAGRAGQRQPGTKGTFAALMPRFAR